MRGCNLRCPYCYNTELVAPSKALQDLNAGAQADRDQPQFVFIQDIIDHLKKRANVLSGFVISGGEPLLHPDTVRQLILQARSLGYKIKLDTNGMFPDRLQELLSDKACAPDYIALDVKTSPARYGELSQAPNAADIKVLQTQEAAAAQSSACDSSSQIIIQSIKIVSALPTNAREFRTVLYPPLVGRAEIEEITSILQKDARWFFAHFLNGRCLSAAAEKVQPYTEDQEAALVDFARATIPRAILR